MVAFVEKTMKDGLKCRNEGTADGGKSPMSFMIRATSKDQLMGKLKK